MQNIIITKKYITITKIKHHFDFLKADDTILQVLCLHFLCNHSQISNTNADDTRIIPQLKYYFEFNNINITIVLYL